MHLEDFNHFVHLFTHYLCSRCRHDQLHPHQPDLGRGLHGHNGEIYQWLLPVAPNSRRILSAALAVSNRAPVNLQETISRAYNSPVNTAVLRERIPAPWRVAVERLIDYRSSVWIKHGIELPCADAYQCGAAYPPSSTRQFVGHMVTELGDHGYYAVELDTVPFEVCADHDARFGSPWAYVAGYIPVQRLHQLSGSLHRPPDRDHLYAVGDIAADEWTFVYRPFGAVVEDVTSQRSALNGLLSSGLPVVPQRTVDLISGLLHLLRNHEQTGNLVK